MNVTSDDKVPLGVTASLSTALVGQNIIFALQLNFLLFAFTDILGLMPAAVGTLLLVARLFDAANDPLMGYITDSTRTRWGKYRPWLVVAPLPLGILSVLLFYNPGLGATETLIYAYVVYFAWTLVYTLTDIPLWSMTATITRNDTERARIVVIIRILAFVGALAPSILVPVIATSVAPESKETGYFIAVLAMVVVAVPMLFAAFFGVREKVQPAREKATIGQVFGLLFSNKPLLLLMMNTILSFMVLAGNSAMPFFAEYLLGDASLTGALMAVSVGGMVAGMAFTPLLARRFGKKETIIVTAFIRAGLLGAFFIIGFNDLWPVFGLLFVSGLLSGPNAALTPVMIGDTIDHMEKTKGNRSEGIAFAAFTFSNKTTTGLAAWFMGMILAMTGYVANQPQTVEAQEGIFWMVTLLPAFSSLASTIPLFFYKLERSEPVPN